jgi:hypothetical protein
MEGTSTQHPTGFICGICKGVSPSSTSTVATFCAHHAVETMVTVDLRAEEPIVTVSTG